MISLPDYSETAPCGFNSDDKTPFTLAAASCRVNIKDVLNHNAKLRAENARLREALGSKNMIAAFKSHDTRAPKSCPPYPASSQITISQMLEDAFYSGWLCCAKQAFSDGKDV